MVRTPREPGMGGGARRARAPGGASRARRLWKAEGVSVAMGLVPGSGATGKLAAGVRRGLGRASVRRTATVSGSDSRFRTRWDLLRASVCPIKPGCSEVSGDGRNGLRISCSTNRATPACFWNQRPAASAAVSFSPPSRGSCCSPFPAWGATPERARLHRSAAARRPYLK